MVLFRRSLLGQTVSFRNHPDIFFDGIDRYVYRDSVGGTRLTGSNWGAELWYGSDANSLTAVAPPIALFRDILANDVAAGTWQGGTRTLSGFGPGQTLTLQIKVWDVSRYATYAEASSSLGAVFGASQPFTYMVAPVGSTQGGEMLNLRAFALVPEPSAVFLALSSLILLLVFTRSAHKRW